MVAIPEAAAFGRPVRRGPVRTNRFSFTATHTFSDWRKLIDGSEKSSLGRDRHRLGAVLGAELVENGGDVELDGAF